MKPVKIAQNCATIYQAENEHYSIDACLPQRKAIEAGKVGFNALSHGHYPGTRIDPELLPGVSSLGYFDVIGAQDWGIPEHRNEGIEICYQETGESVLTVDEVAHQLTANTLSVTRPWQLHSLGDPHMRSGRLHWVIIDVGVRRPSQSWQIPDWCVLTKNDKEELINLLCGNEHPAWPANAEIGRIFEKLGNLVSSEHPEQAISRIRIVLNQLLVAILDLMRSQPVEMDSSLTTNRRVVKLFLKELKRDTKMLAMPWTLEDMATYCGMGRTTFAEYCRDIINTTPLEALNRWRLDYCANRLSSEPKTKIVDIARDAGFSSSQYFARKFQQSYGMSARQWRDKQSS